MKGQVIKILAQSYRVTASGCDYTAVPRGKLRLSGDIFVGDEVELCVNARGAVIEQIYPRKNALVRPYVSNIDAVLIVIAPVPEPDLLLADKIIINAIGAEIEPILIYNKNDLPGDYDKIKSAYHEILPTHSVSTATKNGISDLISAITGKTVCFAGQSAVGKTSLLNCLFEACSVNACQQKVDGISDKSQRGKNTTRHVELYDLKSFRVVDTCGFSMLECLAEDERKLWEYYPEYAELSGSCRFRGCNHREEPDCAVKNAVERGALDAGRYKRYLQIYQELKQKREEKYD